ncbi:MAG: hypothetical protein SNJ70_05305 [Armatimonadota bacterium]
MSVQKILKLCLLTTLLTIILAFSANAEGRLVTVIGGASGMTTDLKVNAVVRGCAPQVMDITLQYQGNSQGTGTVKHAYSAVKMEARDAQGNRIDQWSEPLKNDPNWKPGQVKFTGDEADCEISYMRAADGNVYYAIVIRADSVIGIRWAVNRQKIYQFVKNSGASAGRIFSTATNTDIVDPDWDEVLADINARLAAGGIQIEGGLAECYMDSAVKAIDKYNRLFPAPAGGVVQPGLNPANFSSTKDNILAVAVLAVIYNKFIQEEWNYNEPVNFTTQQLKLITGGKVDYWDAFFSNITDPERDHRKLYNYFREPLSGTSVTYLYQIMRGMEKEANGSEMREYWNGTDWVPAAGWTNTSDPNKDNWIAPNPNYHRSGIPGLTCQQDPASSAAPDAKPGSGAVNTAVSKVQGGIGYTFLQKFTKPGGGYSSVYNNIRVAKVNGFSPYSFESGNSLPGVNGTLEVTDPGSWTSFYQSVIDGNYPLWTYNHVFDGTNGASAGLADFAARFTQSANAPIVRSVGLIPLGDMDAFATTKSVSTSGPNAGRGPGFGRCGFYSPITGEIVRDGMAIMLKDPNTIDGLPGESYPDNRP